MNKKQRMQNRATHNNLQAKTAPQRTKQILVYRQSTHGKALTMFWNKAIQLK